MSDQPVTLLNLARGESQRYLVAAGNTLLVLSGRIVLHGPAEWLAETLVSPQQRLCAEETLVFAQGGWVEVMAGDDAQLALLANRQPGVWQRLAAGLCGLLGYRAAGPSA